MDMERLLQDALAQINEAVNLEALESVRLAYFGKKGALTELSKQLGQVSAEEKPILGAKVSGLRQAINEAFEAKKQLISDALLAEKLASESLDVSLPGRNVDVGSLHPVTQTIARINDWFAQLGFSVEQGPEIEDDVHNFEALNIPETHPARAMHDTFYFDSGLLLRTHTSPVQIRTMERQTPPLRIIAPGRVYRCDSDQTHTPMFHQIEGLVVDKTANFAQLKALLESFLVYFFDDPELKVRFRPSYFPFTEPSAEVDIATHLLGGRWVEVLGCGVVHPNVLSHAGIDPEEYTGFAFGLGVERLAMLRFGIPDLRLLFDNDVRFLRQFQA
ncbi:MAG: phenylalanine--tRNA ligase subunit alpha [Gammaproteobacteria bacterium]|nr:phenylalanine--tRNA ligase subunit alpha [Gammaproteobacteria bacterium]